MLAESAEKTLRGVVHLDFGFDNLKIIMDQQRDFMFAVLPQFRKVTVYSVVSNKNLCKFNFN